MIALTFEEQEIATLDAALRVAQLVISAVASAPMAALAPDERAALGFRFAVLRERLEGAIREN